jgi:hypothetical protein
LRNAIVVLPKWRILRVMLETETPGVNILRMRLPSNLREGLTSINAASGFDRNRFVAGTSRGGVKAIDRESQPHLRWIATQVCA